MLPETPGQVITFYSFKGGTGRSMALANVACLLGRAEPQPGRVLAIDWDLEAPGLWRYFQKAIAAEQKHQPGILDYFSALGQILTPELYADLTSATASNT